MIESTFWTVFTQRFLVSIPSLVVWSAGIILSIIFWRLNRKKFTLTLIPFMIFIINDFINVYINSLLTDKFLSSQITTVQMGKYMEIFNYCITMPAWIFGWVILLIAIFNPKLDSIESIESSLLAKTETN